MHWLQSTLLMDLNGVSMPVLILNVSIYFLGLCSFPLTLWQGPMVSEWKYGSASLVYRNKPGRLSPHLVLSNWPVQISAWILRTGSRPTRTFCRFGPVVEEIRTRSGVWLQPNGLLSLLLLLLYGHIRALDTDGLSSPSRSFSIHNKINLSASEFHWVPAGRDFLLTNKSGLISKSQLLGGNSLGFWIMNDITYWSIPVPVLFKLLFTASLSNICLDIERTRYCRTWHIINTFGDPPASN